MSIKFNNTDLTHQQLRKLERLDGAIDRVSEDDRIFFATHPERNFRIRLISKAERRSHTIINGAVECPPGCRHYIIVKQISPGARVRVGAVVKELNHVERFSDAACALVFEEAARAQP